MRKIYYFIWLISLICFLLGISLPIATVEKFLIAKSEFSLISSLFELVLHPSVQNFVLFVIIFCFSILFPLIKLWFMFLEIKNKDKLVRPYHLSVYNFIAHFAMVDVFVIALMVLLLKLGVLVNVQVHYGFYIFTISVFLMTVLSFMLKQKSNYLSY